MRNGKLTTVPYCPTTGRKADSTKPQTWGSFVSANAAARRRSHDGIGYVFAPDDPFAGVDLDHCRDALTGELSDEARAVVESFASYAEISPSGTGVHLIIRGCVPAGARHKRGNYEAYSQGRFFTVTSQHLESTPAMIEARQDKLDAFIVHYLTEPTREPQRATAPWTHSAHGAHRGGLLDLEDGTILDTALRDPTFAALWSGDMGDKPSASEAVFALLRKLEFYTWGDADRMDRFFRQSGLMSDKWDARRGDGTLGAYNIQKILDTSTGERASYLHLLKSEPDAGERNDAEATPTPEPETVQILRARIVELEALVAAREATLAEKDEMIAQLEHDLAACRDANRRLSTHNRELIEYKRSRDEAEARRQLINRQPSERLSVTDKLVLDCGIRHIRSAQSRGAIRNDGGCRFPLGAPCDEYAISDDAVSKSVHHLEALGYWKCDTTPEFIERIDPKMGKKIGQWIKRLYLLPNEEYISHPGRAIEAAVDVHAPERNHGGKRIRCGKCSSDDVAAQTIYICRACDHEWRSEPGNANPASHSEEPSLDAASPEFSRTPQDAGTEEFRILSPQVAGIGKERPTRPTPQSVGRTARASLCIHERGKLASAEKFPRPQHAGAAHMRVSAERGQQQHDLWRWARANDWTRLTYAPGTSTGGNEDVWGIFLRQAGKADLALAWAAISTEAVQAPGQDRLP